MWISENGPKELSYKKDYDTKENFQMNQPN